MPLLRIQVLYFRARDHFPRRKFGQMKTKKTKHDATNKKVSTASRTERAGRGEGDIKRLKRESESLGSSRFRDRGDGEGEQG